MAEPARRLATYEDVLRAPAHMVAEIIFGEVHLQPRPALRHGSSTLAIGYELVGPFGRGRGGPGGWIFVVEPELHFGFDVVVPDLAGWRTSRLPTVPDEPFITIAPDWILETLSPSTERYDRGPKRAIYARERVPHLWFLSPMARLLETFALRPDGLWLCEMTFKPGDAVSAPPFEAISFPLDDLFPFPDPQAAPEGAPPGPGSKD